MVLVVLPVMALLLGIIAHLINKEQPVPYMDEIFHVPQVQQYCDHNFSHWNHMITTLPGLYISSLLWTEPLQLVLGINLCTVQYLRSQNIVLILCCYLVIYFLFKTLHPHKLSSSSSSSFSFFLVAPLCLVSFPLLFFFSFLYYTDVGSTLLVLAGYLLAIKQRHITSSMVLLCAILFRQTNIIWSGFVAGTVGLRIVEPHLNKGGLTTQLISLLHGVHCSLPALVSSLWSYLLLGIGFCVFVLVNGSIVVGDKSHHVASLNLPQFLYFVGFSCSFSIVPLIFHWKILKKIILDFLSLKYILIIIALTVTNLIVVHRYTYEHPYLLADNRHYTFYVWKNIFKSYPDMKYYLTPLYSVCTIVWVSVLAKRQSQLWVLFFLACCFASLVPQSLLEFRYYIIPYMLYRLHIKPIPVWGCLLEFIHYSFINVVTLWLFLQRPFKWSGHEGLQRFMW